MTTIYSNQGGTWTAVPSPFANVKGTWTPIKSAYQNQGGTWNQIWTAYVPPPNPPTGSISPSSQTKNGSVNQSVQFNATISASGGTPPYSYIWQFRAPNGQQIGSGNSANISESVSANAKGTYNFTIVGNVTDSTGSVSSQFSATATLVVS